MNTYRTSTGERFTQSKIDLKIRAAKAEKLRSMQIEFGYIFCEQCGHNGSGSRLDCSHDYSVGQSKKDGKVEP